MHEFSVGTLEPGDAVEDITPEVVVVALFDDAVVCANRNFYATKHGGAGKFLEHHGHFPFKEGLIFVLCDRGNIHAQLFAALRQPIA